MWACTAQLPAGLAALLSMLLMGCIPTPSHLGSPLWPPLQLLTPRPLLSPPTPRLFPFRPTQEVASNHAVAMWGRSDEGFATDPALADKGLIFVMTRLQIQMDEYPRWCVWLALCCAACAGHAGPALGMRWGCCSGTVRITRAREAVGCLGRGLL